MGMRPRGRIRRGSRQRASEAASQARRAVENTAAGWRSAEGSAIVTPPGPCCAPHVGVRDKLPQRAPSGAPPGLTRRLRRRPKQEVRRQAKLHLVGSSGRRNGKAPRPRRRRVNAQGESALRSPRAARHTGAPRDTARWSVAERRSQEPSSPQGARDGSRLQKSVRRIFPVLYGLHGASRAEREEPDSSKRPAGL